MSELFNLYWRRIIPLGQTSSIAFPFSRLHNEPFWELLPLPGNEIIPAGQIQIDNRAKNFSPLRDQVMNYVAVIINLILSGRIIIRPDDTAPTNLLPRCHKKCLPSGFRSVSATKING